MTVWDDAGLTRPSLSSDGAPEAVDALEYLLGRATVPSDLMIGEFVTDYGAVGDGSTNDRAAIIAAADAAVTKGTRVVIFPTPPVAWTNFGAAIELDSYPHQMRFTGMGGSATSDPQFGFSRVPLRGPAAAAFFTANNVNTPNRLVTFENLYMTQGQCFFHSDPTVNYGGYADSLFRFYNCGAAVSFTGHANNVPVIVETAFWVFFDKCSFYGPLSVARTVGSHTLSTAGSPITVTVTSTAGFPSSGTVAIGQDGVYDAYTMHYTSKDATHLYGCYAVGPTPTYPDNTVVFYQGASMVFRGAGAVGSGGVYNLCLTECILSGEARYEINNTAGDALLLLLDRVSMENSIKGILHIVNNSGTTGYVRTVTIRDCINYDPYVNTVAAEGESSVVRLTGANPINLSKLIIDNSNVFLTPQIYMSDAASSVSGSVRGADFNGVPGQNYYLFSPFSDGNASNLISEGPGGLFVVTGDVSSALSWVGINDGHIYLGGGAILDSAGHSVFGGYEERYEMTAPSAAPANSGRMFMRDNGSGKTQLCVIFASGAIQVIATQP